MTTLPFAKIYLDIKNCQLQFMFGRILLFQHCACALGISILTAVANYIFQTLLQWNIILPS